MLGYICLGPLSLNHATAEYSDGALVMVLGYNCGMLVGHFIPFRRMKKRRKQIGLALKPVIFLSPGRHVG